MNIIFNQVNNFIFKVIFNELYEFIKSRDHWRCFIKPHLHMSVIRILLRNCKNSKIRSIECASYIYLIHSYNVSRSSILLDSSTYLSGHLKLFRSVSRVQRLLSLSNRLRNAYGELFTTLINTWLRKVNVYWNMCTVLWSMYFMVNMICVDRVICVDRMCILYSRHCTVYIVKCILYTAHVNI